MKARIFFSPLRFHAFVLLAAFTVFTPFTSLAEQSARRIILKDGSYQSITKYEVKGDRVRYLSAERNEWEELPASLVDWPATEKYERDRAATPPLPDAALIDKESAADRQADEQHLPEVAPGLHLPEFPGLFLLDNFKGQAQLVEVQQTEGDVNHNTKSNILRGLSPVASARQTIELEGAHAAVFAHVSVPAIYINVEEEAENGAPPGQTDSARPSQPSLDAPRAEPQQPEQRQQAQKATLPFNRFHIVKLKVKGGKRMVGEIKRAPTGKTTQDQDSVRTTITRVGSGWLKLTPIEDLAPGEYAIVETTGSDTMNLYVWPFAVKPDAPANANPWTPDAKKAEGDKAKENLLIR